MKHSLIILVLGLSFLTARADHITGGEMYYNFLSSTNGVNTYNVTLKLFMRCNSGRQFPDPAIISVFDKLTKTRVADITQNITQRETIRLNNDDPCITDPPSVCYEVAYYNFAISVPANSNGYILASEVNYRIRGIANITSNQVGATYTCEIPGSNSVNEAYINTSARFTGSDLVVVCSDNYFEYSFGATDADGDGIRYSFCSAYNSSSGSINGSPAGIPPYFGLHYNEPFFDGSHPLGPDVTIDQQTGLISGVAPAAGIYVVTVCAEEIRNNRIISVQRKDLQINITDCSIASARLERDYMLCRDTRSMTFRNLSNSPLIVSYDWSVMAPNGNVIHTATTSDLSYTFAANGLYTVKIVVNRGEICSDSTTAPVYVFPGMITDFTTRGICINKVTEFRDRSTTPNGNIDTWKWDFGEPGTAADISLDRNPVYTYPSLGTKRILLTVTATTGCRDTVSKAIDIITEPPITLAFRDTLICLRDQLPLQASGQGAFSWSPVINMTNGNTASPTVSPTVTTKYYVDLDADGCVNRDSVLVRVVDHVTLNVMPDTTICSTDTIQIRTQSDALHFTWTPASQLIDPTVKDPVAVTAATTDYRVTGVIGGCSEQDAIRVTAIPYPLAALGADTTICYNSSTQLQAVTDGTIWTWTPSGSLSTPSSLNPLAAPVRTTSYIFAAYKPDSGCPKPGRDTMTVTVLPKILAYAGADTAAVVSQPLQLQASGGVDYRWSPAFNLSAANISNPVAIFSEPAENIRYKVHVFNSAGCVDSAFLSIKVFATGPTVFVPTAFTPNNDGRNDRLMPVAVGMKQIHYFSVFNRWGQLVFTTQVNGGAWDGTVNGQPQASNSYVWMVKATDFNGNVYFRKGTVTLIR